MSTLLIYQRYTCSITGNFSIFKTCIELFAKHPDKYVSLDPKQQDRNGDTLFHLLVREKCNNPQKQIAEILQQKHVPCRVQNKEGKFPLDYLRANDLRYKILQKAMEYDRSQIKNNATQNKPNDKHAVHKPSVEMRKEQLVVEMTPDSTPEKQPEIVKESYLSQIKKLIGSLSHKTSPREHLGMEQNKEIDVS